MNSNFLLTFTATDKYQEENFKMSGDEIQAHFPKQLEMLQNSPCSAVAMPNKNGDCTVIIEKIESSLGINGQSNHHRTA
ncbi:hypothetical protein VF14_36660 [Nostoc linckia z18]|jgi:hypothetical protein|uniref:Uncharacterized protein n=2 Tax=Nostoc linckia TaxID=92942 RepID=A0A9Q5Z497_NOSLI|nr:hypothetical protein [Nostoc linckia]PHK25739.1 hypothetical protein VF12_36690 [Nostoc linckia z15]PHK36127.1 hypothetical protein VF13_37230 [Nostoc linckia z16]PHJ55334.1 hypothetical protein VF02_35975 [Nostoc linckia z1]PHJ56721.1 hypothetical protein VF05_36810 [Nostoc linckia z3]PHJ57729.1 hypothetical protein VF03_36185 [Nostoc linckia z2]